MTVLTGAKRKVVRYREEEVSEGQPGLGRRSPARSPGRTTGRSFSSLRRQARMETDDIFQAGSEGNTEVRERVFL